ncbi:hypothetical protein D3C78_1403910 [compost metagenome]
MADPVRHLAALFAHEGGDGRQVVARIVGNAIAAILPVTWRQSVATHLGNPRVETGTRQVRRKAQAPGRIPEPAIGKAAVQQDDRNATAALPAETAKAGQHQLDAGVGAVGGFEAIDVFSQIATEFRAHQRNGKEIATALHDCCLHKKGRV